MAISGRMNPGIDFISMIYMGFCALDTIQYTVYNKIELSIVEEHSSMLPFMLWSTLLITLKCTLSVYLTVHSQLLSMTHSRSAWLALSCKLSRYIHLDSWDTSKYTSKYVFRYNSGHALMEAYNCTHWHASGLFDSILLRMFWRGLQVHCVDIPMYIVNMIGCTPLSMFSRIVLDMITTMLLIGLDGISPAYLTLHFKVSSQNKSK